MTDFVKLQNIAILQDSVRQWCVDCFGEVTANDAQERNFRFLEEALELVQSCGATAADAHKLVDYVFGRPVGDPPQEVGGTVITLAALCAASNINFLDQGLIELDRIKRPYVMEKIRAKQASKPHKSPLPGKLEDGAPTSSKGFVEVSKLPRRLRRD